VARQPSCNREGGTRTPHPTVTASFEFHFHSFLLSAKPKIGGRICGSGWERCGCTGLRIGLAEGMKGGIYGKRIQGKSKTRQELALVVCSSQQQKRATLGPDDGGKLSIQLMGGPNPRPWAHVLFLSYPIHRFPPSMRGQTKARSRDGNARDITWRPFFFLQRRKACSTYGYVTQLGGICSGHGGAQLQATCKKRVDQVIW
jgi:hypothetical protein